MATSTWKKNGKKYKPDGSEDALDPASFGAQARYAHKNRAGLVLLCVLKIPQLGRSDPIGREARVNVESARKQMQNPESDLDVYALYGFLNALRFSLDPAALDPASSLNIGSCWPGPVL